MSVLEKIESYLGRLHAPFAHSAYPQVERRKLVKAQVLLADDAFAMAVLPVDAVIDTLDLQHVLGVRSLRPATKLEIARLFPGCDRDAVPPFGQLYGVRVYVESSLMNEDTIAFYAGTHQDVIYIRFADFCRAASPIVLPLARRKAA